LSTTAGARRAATAALGGIVVLVGLLVSGVFELAARHSPPAMVSPPTTAMAPLPAAPSQEEVAGAIQRLLAAAPTVEPAPFTPFEVEEALRRFYGSRRWAPRWLGSWGSETPDTVVDVVRRMKERGLDPARYGIDLLEHRVAALATGGTRTPASEQAALDVALTRAVLTVMRHLARGRVDPRALGYHYDLEPEPVHLAALLEGAAPHDGLERLFDRLEPPFPQYSRLKTELVRYRAMAGRPPPVLPDLRKVEPGDGYAAVDELARTLVAVGDLPADAQVAPGRYEGALVEAVRRFQARHGIEVDGVIGKNTLRHLRTPLTARIAQIQLGLERMRWLPRATHGPVIVVNVPDFHLYGFDAAASERPDVEMDVVIGRAARTETPLVTGLVRQMVVRPFWHVPGSIVRNEIVPVLRRDPTYLTRERLDIIASPRDDAPALAVDATTVDRLRAGRLFLRQRPGPHNALGRLKFVFPNRFDVHMHDTPSRALFARARRDFSHGCIRVSDPVGLALYLLRDRPEWTRESLEAAMDGARTFTIDMPTPVPVLVFYNSAIARPDGTLQFFDDIYGYDAQLARVLADAAGEDSGG
jgi:murein L,D-transpeptidase YcbB/YkuD